MKSAALFLFCTFMLARLHAQCCDSTVSENEKQYLLSLSKKYPKGLTYQKGRDVKIMRTQYLFVRDSSCCAELFIIERTFIRKTYVHNGTPCSRHEFKIKLKRAEKWCELKQT